MTRHLDEHIVAAEYTVGTVRPTIRRLLLIEQCQRLALTQLENFSDALQLRFAWMDLARLPLVDRQRGCTQKLGHLLLRESECSTFFDQRLCIELELL